MTRARTAAAQAEQDPLARAANDEDGDGEDDTPGADDALDAAAAAAAITTASGSTLAEADGAPILTMAEAEARALEWQRLRKALQQLHRAPPAEVATLLQADGDAAARGALVIAAAAAGRSLLDSPVLAAAEVARQMRREQMRRPTAGPAAGPAAGRRRGRRRRRRRGRRRGGGGRCRAGGAPEAAPAAEPSLAWLLSTAGREACRVRLARLDADLARLTTRGPAPVDDERPPPRQRPRLCPPCRWRRRGGHASPSRRRCAPRTACTRAPPTRRRATSMRSTGSSSSLGRCGWLASRRCLRERAAARHGAPFGRVPERSRQPLCHLE